MHDDHNGDSTDALIPRRPPRPDSAPHLTPRQYQVLQRLAAGATIMEITQEFHITLGTASTHINGARDALGITRTLRYQGYGLLVHTAYTKNVLPKPRPCRPIALTPQQRALGSYVAQGLTAAQTAELLGTMSASMVRNHLRVLIGTVQSRNRWGMVTRLHQLGVLGAQDITHHLNPETGTDGVPVSRRAITRNDAPPQARHLLTALAHGLPMPAAAEDAGLSALHAQQHLDALKVQFGLASLPALVFAAYHCGLLDWPSADTALPLLPQPEAGLLTLITLGMDADDMADQLRAPVDDIQNTARSLIRTLNANSPAHLVTQACRTGLITPHAYPHARTSLDWDYHDLRNRLHDPGLIQHGIRITTGRTGGHQPLHRLAVPVGDNRRAGFLALEDYAVHDALRLLADPVRFPHLTLRRREPPMPHPYVITWGAPSPPTPPKPPVCSDTTGRASRNTSPTQFRAAWHTRRATVEERKCPPQVDVFPM